MPKLTPKLFFDKTAPRMALRAKPADESIRFEAKKA
jgi:hypothetical protein